MLRLKLLRRYYKSAVLGWFHPKSMHWTKIVDSNGRWRWIQSERGVRGRLLKNPPLHIYQTVLRFRTETPPRGRRSSGFILGGPLIFDLDIIDKYTPFSLWRIVDTAAYIQELVDNLLDRGAYKIRHVMFSGLRGIHVVVDQVDQASQVIPIGFSGSQSRLLRSFIRERYQIARAIGKWCPGWDWRVCSDPWRVSRIPWSMHGQSALRAILLKSPYTADSFENQLIDVSPFSFTRRINVRITRSVPIFTFVDAIDYGPFRKGWATKLPVAVALHLIWQGFAKTRESGPEMAGAWFERGWQSLFHSASVAKVENELPWGVACG